MEAAESDPASDQPVSLICRVQFTGRLTSSLALVWAATATACTMSRQANLLMADPGQCFMWSSTGSRVNGKEQ